MSQNIMLQAVLSTIKQVGRDLDVRYVLEGSVRRAGDHVRITGQREVGFFIPEPVA